MIQREKGAFAPSQMQDKGSKTFVRKQTMLNLLRRGQRITATEANGMFHFNDTRKMISDLRKDGYRIKDFRLADGRKVYYMQEDRQLSLFNEATPKNNEPQRVGEVMRGLADNPDSLMYYIAKHREEVRNGK